jgi:large subunit ribosomal protein L13
MGCLKMKRSKTYSLKAKEIEKDWHVIDATGQTLGRLASRVAHLLMGKHKPTYTPHLDMGDYVVVINAEKVRVTGKKLTDKVYYRHSGYMGGLKMRTLREMLERRPTRVVELAVRGMLPHNRLGRRLYRHLKVYAGPDHPHTAQVNAARKRRAAQASQPIAAAEGEQPS